MKPPAPKLTLKYAIFVVLISAACFAAWRTERAAAKAKELVAHSILVQKELGGMLTCFTRLESNCWAFLLTGDPKFLGSQNSDRAAIQESIGKLKAWTVDNAAQQNSIARLEELQAAQVAFKDRLISVNRSQGLDAGRLIAQMEAGSKLAAFQEGVRAMIAEEDRLLVDRAGVVVMQDRSGWWLFAGVAAVAVVFLTLSNMRIQRMLAEATTSATELTREQARLVEAQSLAKVGSWTWEVGSESVAWSDELYHIFRIPRDKTSPVFREYKNLFAPESEARLAIGVEAAVTSATTFSMELEGIRSDGERFVAWATGRAERDEGGNVVRLFGTAQDITESRETLERERELRRAAQVALEAKEHFLAVMSHEIRTPINGILGFVDQLAEHPLPSEHQECVRVIQASGKSLLRIVNEIFDFSLIQSGKLTLKNEPFSLRRLFEKLQGLLSQHPEHGSVRFVTEISPDVPDGLIGDVGRLGQILENLGENALKFTVQGSVTMAAKELLDHEGANAVHIEFTVRDTGIGISAEKLDEIFEPFTQGESTLRRRYGGTGLGLSISRKLAQLLGGELTVKSTLGQGSEFTFSVPLKVAPTALAGKDSDVEESLGADFAQRHPLSIIVAEDDRINSRVILHLLGRLGYEARHAWNGREIIEQCRRQRPDCIVMDLHMPELDGFEATRAIRSEEKTSGLPPIYIAALTADILPKARRDCIDAGMEDYLTKPINVRDLADALLRCG